MIQIDEEKKREVSAHAFAALTGISLFSVLMIVFGQIESWSQQTEMRRRMEWMERIDTKMDDRFRGSDFRSHLIDQHAMSEDEADEYLDSRPQLTRE